MPAWLNEALAFIAALFVGREAAVALAASRSIPAIETFGLAIVWYTFLSLAAYGLIRGFDHNRWVHRKLKTAERARVVRWLDKRPLPQYLVLCVVFSPLPNSFWPTLFLAYVAHTHRRIKWMITPVIGALGYMSFHAAYKLAVLVTASVDPLILAAVAILVVASGAVAYVRWHPFRPDVVLMLTRSATSMARAGIVGCRCYQRQQSDYDLFVSHAILIRGPPSRAQKEPSSSFLGPLALSGLLRAIIEL